MFIRFLLLTCRPIFILATFISYFSERECVSAIKTSTIFREGIWGRMNMSENLMLQLGSIYKLKERCLMRFTVAISGSSIMSKLYLINIYLRRHHGGFPAFRTDDVTIVVPTKVHVVPHRYIIQGFISDGLYLMVKMFSMYEHYTMCLAYVDFNCFLYSHLIKNICLNAV